MPGELFDPAFDALDCSRRWFGNFPDLSRAVGGACQHGAAVGPKRDGDDICHRAQDRADGLAAARSQIRADSIAAADEHGAPVGRESPGP